MISSARLIRLIGGLLQTSEMLSLRQMCIDRLGADAVVPAKHHSVLQELLACLGDSDLVVPDVKHHELHEVSLDLDLTSGLQVLTGENQLSDFILCKDKNLEPSQVTRGDQSSEASILDPATFELQKL